MDTNKRLTYEAPDSSVVIIRMEKHLLQGSNTLRDMGYNEIVDEDLDEE